MKPGVAKGIHWRPKQSISQQVRTENITYLLTDRYVLGHVTGLNGFYLSRFKTPFSNLPVLYIPWMCLCALIDAGSYYDQSQNKQKIADKVASMLIFLVLHNVPNWTFFVTLCTFTDENLRFIAHILLKNITLIIKRICPFSKHLILANVPFLGEMSKSRAE